MTYVVVQDDMGTKLKINVSVDIDEKQLRATLRKAADDHQYDAARDLCFLITYGWRHISPTGRRRVPLRPGVCADTSRLKTEIVTLEIGGTGYRRSQVRKISSPLTFPTHVSHCLEIIFRAT